MIIMILLVVYLSIEREILCVIVLDFNISRSLVIIYQGYTLTDLQV
jgi:hypothetical protein